MTPTQLVSIVCPYCGETVEISVDCSVDNQSYIEDCQVCCRPMDISVSLDADGELRVEVSREDDT
jgi:Cysteine-rich CPXCG